MMGVHLPEFFFSKSPGRSSALRFVYVFLILSFLDRALSVAILNKRI